MGSTKSVQLEWTGDNLSFKGKGRDSESPEVTLDPQSKLGPTPMDALLIAAAGCSGADVVSILKKMRVDLKSVSIEIDGDRREEHPKRYTALRYRFIMSGEGLDKAKADRAVGLSIEKYCSVLHSLSPDIHLSHETEVV